MNTIDLKKVLELHAEWLRGGRGGQRADLSGANLSGADLWRADLSRADLLRADLSGANLLRANLLGANLSGANLSGANLSDANLSRANLLRADLLRANLSGADLSGANLSGANLSGACLSDACLSGADLSGAEDGEICRMDFGGWSICVRYAETSIGCQTHPNEKWLSWSPDDVANMHCEAKEWWSVHGDAVKAAIRCVMSKRRPT